MSQIIPFESAKLPAHIAKAFMASDDLSSGVGGGGFPHVSIKGKVFHITRGGETTLIAKPGGDPDDPASSIEVVIVKANPALSKVYYSGGYTEGSDAKPLCYSNDGVAPAADSQEPQAKKCATCPHNQWGSRITENGGKGKSCADSRRIAIAPVTQINDPMLLRVPAASLKTLAQYNDSLKKRGVGYPAVVTKISFDHKVAHPALMFKPVGFIDDATAEQVLEVMNSDIVSNIIGTAPVDAFESSYALPEADEPEIVKAAPAPKAAAPKKSAALDEIIESAKVTTKVNVEAEEEAPAPKAAAPKRQDVVEVDTMDDMMAELDSMIGDD